MRKGTLRAQRPQPSNPMVCPIYIEAIEIAKRWLLTP